MIDSISAITLATRDMRRAVEFYRMLGFELAYGGEEAVFTNFRAGANFLNLIAQPAETPPSWWGRNINESDLDALFARLTAAGCRTLTVPRDAEWGERFFHVVDPDGHELSSLGPWQRLNSRRTVEVSRAAAHVKAPRRSSARTHSGRLPASPRTRELRSGSHVAYQLHERFGS